jgi:flagellar basal body-associated protein FliL
MADESEPKSSNPALKLLLKKIIMGVVAIAVLGGGGFFGFKAFKSWRAKKAAAALAAQNAPPEPPKDPDEEFDEAMAKGGGHGGASGPAILALKPIVNLEGPRKNAYLKCELHIIFRDPTLGKEATSDKPTAENSEIRATILEILSGKTVEDVSDVETREAIRLDIKDKLNERFKPKPLKPGEKEDKAHKRPNKPIKDVLVVDWAIQQ